MPESSIFDRDAGKVSTRANVQHMIASKPGITKVGLQKRLGIGWGTVTYHVDRLASVGTIRIHRAHGRAHLFPAGFSDGMLPAGAALATWPAEIIIARLREHDGARVCEIARSLGLSRKLVRRTLNLLIRYDVASSRGRHQPRFTVKHETLTQMTPQPSPTSTSEEAGAQA